MGEDQEERFGSGAVVVVRRLDERFRGQDWDHTIGKARLSMLFILDGGWKAKETAASSNVSSSAVRSPPVKVPPLGSHYIDDESQIQRPSHT